MFGVLFYLVPVVLCYLYGFFTVGKFIHYKGLLDHDPETDAFSIASVWPLAIAVEPGLARGLILPSLWLWPRFREEYPEIRAKKDNDSRREANLRKRETRRVHDEKFGNLTLEDARAEVAHAKAMEVLRRDTDTFQQKLVDDYPPAIEANDKYDPETREVINSKAVVHPTQQAKEQAEPDILCTVHRHYVSLAKINDPYNNCSDKGPRLNL